MALIRELPGAHLWVRWVEEGRIELSSGPRLRSFALSPREAWDWGPERFEAIDQAACELLLAAQPELVLIGTGSRQRWLAPELQAAFLARRVGLEVMDNRACARTFNLLAAEGRAVVAAFLIEPR